MQTFLPFPDFADSAASLDPRRLGKQRVEVLQIVRAITWPKYGWRNHPAANMWRGFEEALGAYGVAICREWCARGFADTCDAKIRQDLADAGVATIRSQAELDRLGLLPPWIGDEALHRSHRASLLRKDPDWYGPRFPDAPDDTDYLWPTRTPTSTAE